MILEAIGDSVNSTLFSDNMIPLDKQIAGITQAVGNQLGAITPRLPSIIRTDWILASKTVTPPPGANVMYVTACGGGGGGSYRGNVTSGTTFEAGSGGDSVIRMRFPLTNQASFAVTIGVGGARAVASGSSSSNGSTGGTTVIGVYLSLSGGYGGGAYSEGVAREAFGGDGANGHANGGGGSLGGGGGGAGYRTMDQYNNTYVIQPGTGGVGMIGGSGYGGGFNSGGSGVCGGGGGGGISPNGVSGNGGAGIAIIEWGYEA